MEEYINPLQLPKVRGSLPIIEIFSLPLSIATKNINYIFNSTGVATYLKRSRNLSDLFAVVFSSVRLERSHSDGAHKVEHLETEAEFRSFAERRRVGRRISRRRIVF